MIQADSNPSDDLPPLRIMDVRGGQQRWDEPPPRFTVL